MAEDKRIFGKKKGMQIRNSTVDFFVFTKDAHEDGIEVHIQNQDV